MSPLEAEAHAFAAERHHDQRYGDHPYTVHLAQVRAVLSDFEYNGALGLAAWLHDVVEDTSTSVAEITDRFGAEVAALVWAVTGVGHNRKERSASAYAKIRALPEAAILKLADRIANVEASAQRPDKLQMYQQEAPAFAKALEGLGDARMWARLGRAMTTSAPPR